MRIKHDVYEILLIAVADIKIKDTESDLSETAKHWFMFARKCCLVQSMSDTSDFFIGHACVLIIPIINPTLQSCANGYMDYCKAGTFKGENCCKFWQLNLTCCNP